MQETRRLVVGMLKLCRERSRLRETPLADSQKDKSHGIYECFFDVYLCRIGEVGSEMVEKDSTKEQCDFTGEKVTAKFVCRHRNSMSRRKTHRMYLRGCSGV